MNFKQALKWQIEKVNGRQKKIREVIREVIREIIPIRNKKSHIKIAIVSNKKNTASI